MLMATGEIHEINLYCSPASLLVVTGNGLLLRIYCPFTVLVIREVDCYKVGEKLSVIQVKMDVKLTLVYIINNKGYYYYNFALLL